MNIRLSLIFLTATTILCLFNCGSGASDSDHEKAVAIYHKTVELETEVRAIMGSLQQVVARDRGRAGYGVELEKLVKAMEDWEKQAASPGVADSDYLGHIHPQMDGVADEQKLAVQREMNAKLNIISRELLQLMERMQQ